MVGIVVKSPSRSRPCALPGRDGPDRTGNAPDAPVKHRESAQPSRPPACGAAPRLQKRRAILLFAQRVLSFNKAQPGGARSAHARPSRTGLPGSAIETSKGRRAMNDWTGRALDELLRLRDLSGAWGYRNDLGPSAEPTALACLGLWSCRSHSPPEARRGV